ncbi:MAG: hypothetical protein J2P25_22730, partial [Nocardiopsaceae bacterium]|nr:hypothetical protein [Nocardiopsaceae bacterium]
AIMAPARRARPPAVAAVALDLAGTFGLAGIAMLVWLTTEHTVFLYRGGMILLSLATAMTVAAAATPGSVIGRVLGCQPLRWLGVRSYGIYLWHYPIIVMAAPPLGAAFGAGRAAAVVAATVTVSAVSWWLVEEPVRRGRLPRLPRLSRATPRRRPVPVLSVGGLGLTVLAGLAFLVPRLTAHRQPESSAARPDANSVQTPAAAGRHAPAGIPGAGGTSRSPVPDTRATPNGHAARPASQAVPAPSRTSCRSVVHIGDSTSEGLTSPAYLPNPAQRITARYAAAGVVHQNMQISGGRSIVETLPGQQNAYTVAKHIIADGYRGCWVLALGTDDTADVAAGSNVSLTQRIQRMMSAIGNQPVLWVNVKTLVHSGPYSERNMTAWNRALARELPHYRNMRIYDWAAAVRPGWFISDGIHYTSSGYAHRARMIAAALAAAFPAAGHA